MSDTAATTRKARAEVENLVDELVLTIEDGVTHPDGSPGFDAGAAEQLRSDLRSYAEAVLAAARDAARGREPADLAPELSATVDAAVDTIWRGVLDPAGGPGFGAEQADELKAGLQRFADAIVTAAGEGTWPGVDGPVRDMVRTVRSGLFLVYGRASYAAITGDQLEAYLQTFADAVVAVVEREPRTATPSTG